MVALEPNSFTKEIVSVAADHGHYIIPLSIWVHGAFRNWVPHKQVGYGVNCK